ncbi:unnamed protein product [Prunus armeniaca]|uniref:Uncharacterized protein n=1 Tax=Prunus armeniaca TaxID=36596 RepID=A0A6J5U090_PRUAR|nr:unnamed protein product [Prunus armeniaca]CAB4299008.1 unnamed protein product [Prunus armeniaca]
MVAFDSPEVAKPSMEDEELMVMSPQQNKKRRLEVDVAEGGCHTRLEVVNANSSEVLIQLGSELAGSPCSKSLWDGLSGEAESSLKGGRSGLELGLHGVTSPLQLVASSKRRGFPVGEGGTLLEICP